MVLVIIAILATLVAPRYGEAIARARVAAAADRVVAECDRARAQARATSESWLIAFDAANDTLFRRDVALLRPMTASQTIALSDEPYRTDILSAALDDGGASVEFDLFGRPDTGAAIRLQSGVATRRVRIEASTGVIEVDR